MPRLRYPPIHTDLGAHIRALYPDEPPSESVIEFARVFDATPKRRGPAQDESEFCDPFDAAGMARIEGRAR